MKTTIHEIRVTGNGLLKVQTSDGSYISTREVFSNWAVNTPLYGIPATIKADAYQITAVEYGHTGPGPR